MSTLSIAIQLVTEVLAKEIRQLKETKGIQIEKEEVKVYTHRLYISDSKNSTRKMFHLTAEKLSAKLLDINS